MKKLLLSGMIGLALTVSASFATDGKTIFQSKGCAACHNPTADTVGPSLKKIAAAYKGHEGDLIKFLKGEGQAKVDPAKFAMMKPQLNTTKALPEDQLKALVNFIVNH